MATHTMASITTGMSITVRGDTGNYCGSAKV